MLHRVVARVIGLAGVSASRRSRRARHLAALVLAAVSVVAGCTLDPLAATIGVEAAGGTAGANTGGAAGLPFEGGGAELRVHIEGPSHAAISTFALACGSPCVEVRVVARGGAPPYVFHWDDGAVGDARLLCPLVSSVYFVAVTDTPPQDSEFARAPKTAAASLTVTVPDCPRPDGGTPPDPGGPLCVQNPSLEGTPGIAFLPPLAEWWRACPALSPAYLANESLNGTSGNAWIYPPPSDGSTYGVVGQNSGFGDTGSSIAQVLCAPIPAGESRSFLIDAARAQTPGSTVSAVEAFLRIEGGAEECAATELLWTSNALTASWTSFCVTLRPHRETRSLTFRAFGDGGASIGAVAGILFDHIVPVDSCP